METFRLVLEFLKAIVWPAAIILAAVAVLRLARALTKLIKPLGTQLDGNWEVLAGVGRPVWVRVRNTAVDRKDRHPKADVPETAATRDIVAEQSSKLDVAVQLPQLANYVFLLLAREGKKAQVSIIDAVRRNMHSPDLPLGDIDDAFRALESLKFIHSADVLRGDTYPPQTIFELTKLGKELHASMTQRALVAAFPE